MVGRWYQRNARRDHAHEDLAGSQSAPRLNFGPPDGHASHETVNCSCISWPRWPSLSGRESPNGSGPVWLGSGRTARGSAGRGRSCQQPGWLGWLTCLLARRPRSCGSRYRPSSDGGGRYDAGQPRRPCRRCARRLGVLGARARVGQKTCLERGPLSPPVSGGSRSARAWVIKHMFDGPVGSSWSTDHLLPPLDRVT